MIGLGTNVLVRCYVEDAADHQARHQREGARRLIESGRPLMVSKSVILELEGVMRGYYGFSPAQVTGVMRHLLGLAQVTLEDRDSIQQALSHSESGIDFADALHHASYRGCTSVASFDDRQFARRARRIGLTPNMTIPA